MYSKNNFSLQNLKNTTFEKLNITTYINNIKLSVGLRDFNFKSLPKISFSNVFIPVSSSDSNIYLGSDICLDLTTKNLFQALFLTGITVGNTKLNVTWGIKSIRKAEKDNLYPTLKLLVSNSVDEDWIRYIDLELDTQKYSELTSEDLTKSFFQKGLWNIFDYNLAMAMNLDAKTTLKFRFSKDLILDFLYFRDTGFCKFGFNSRV